MSLPLTRRGPFGPVPWLLVALLAGVAAADGPAARESWTSSAFRGTPEPPPPYAAEPAFPKLTFDRPVVLAPAPGTGRLFVGELGGKILSFPEDPTADHADLALDLSARDGGCGGLYGLAFHPDFARNRQVFVCSITRPGLDDGTRVSRYRVNIPEDGPPTIDPASEEVILTWYSGGHNAGCLQFGPDGCLYIGAGDGADPAPPDSFATGQDISDLLSSILRIDVDHPEGGKPYGIPEDNPFVEHPGARPEVWAYGLRNPWRFSIDTPTGEVWVGDVGWELWELVFRVQAGTNCGWALKEGPQPVRSDITAGPTPITPPLAAHPHSEAASMTGGHVYRGDRIKDLTGDYIYGDYQSGVVWALDLDPATRQVVGRRTLADTGLRLVSFGVGSKDELYLIEMERTNQIYRLVENPADAGSSSFPRRLSESGLFASTAGQRPAPGVIPYGINAAMWSDGATAERLMAVPGTGQVEVGDDGRWRLPEGSVMARTVSVGRRRVETQVLHLEGGAWRPYSYRWADDGSDATLVEPAGAIVPIEVADPDAPGGTRTRNYRIAARSECGLCHNPWVEARTTVFGRQSASPLALTTAQLDRGDQLARFEATGLVGPSPGRGRVPTLVDPYNESADLDLRARTYLQVNCAHCHQFGAGGTATIQLSADLPREAMKLVGEAPLQGNFGIENARLVAPGEPERSVLYYRTCTSGGGRMPRIGSDEVDAEGVKLLAAWIASMRGEAATDDLTTDPIGSTRSALATIRRIDRGEISAEDARAMAERSKAAPSAEVRDLFERFLPASERVERLGDAIDAEALLAVGGDPERGRRWFASASATSCASCHKVGGEGGEVGPALDDIGSKYDRRALLVHILEPSREVDPKYAARTVATADGRVITGLLVERNGAEVVLREANGATNRIPLDQVEEEAASPKSLMPEGLLRDLTVQQAADLLEFLATRRSGGDGP